MYQNKNKKNYEFNSDANILSITINDNQLKDVQLIIKNIKNNFKYLKLKSTNIESNKYLYFLV